jgi:hypothetical protein
MRNMIITCDQCGNETDGTHLDGWVVAQQYAPHQMLYCSASIGPPGLTHIYDFCSKECLELWRAEHVIKVEQND